MSVCPICRLRVKRKNRKRVKGIWTHKLCPILTEVQRRTLSNLTQKHGRVLWNLGYHDNLHEAACGESSTFKRSMKIVKEKLQKTFIRKLVNG
jgi:hypothetical protein